MNWNYVLFSIICTGLIALGWLSNDLYDSYSTERMFDGLRLSSVNEPGAIETAKSFDGKGDWVCVNVDGMDYNRMVETCQHEAGHEIFAGIIEKNPEKIPEVMEVVGK